MGIAARVAARLRDWPSGWMSGPTSGGVSPITFPTVPLVIAAEVFIDGTWVDITSGPNGIYYETRIKIKRGRENESTRAQPSSCKVRLKNPNGWWSPRNTQGPYYGKLGRNVKLRITVNPGDGNHVRFTGFVSKWPQQWTTGSHRWVNLEANGILRRLGQGKSPLRSAIYRSVMSQTPNAFWPLDDVSGTAASASSVAGGTPMVPTNGAAIAGTTDTPSGVPAVTINAGTLTGKISPTLAGNSDGWIFSFAMRALKVPLAAQPFLDPVVVIYTDSNDVRKWDMVLAEADVGFAGEWNGSTPAGTLVMTANADPFVSDAEYNDEWKYYQLLLIRTGLELRIASYYQGGLVSTGGPLVLTSPTAGNITDIVFNPNHADMSSLNVNVSAVSVLPRNAISTGTAFSYPLVSDSDAFAGWPGEMAARRFERLCTEEGIDYTIVETDPDTEGMGPQGIKSLLDLLRECEAANEGIIDETTDGKLRLISRSAFYNQPAAMTIDYTAGDIKDPFIPTDDDLISRNDWTITRAGGNSRQYVKSEGPLNVNSPVDDSQGIYRYDDSATLSLETDDQAYQHATYRVAHGTVDEMRISIMALHFSSSPNLLAAWLAMDMAETSRFLINSTPVDMGSLPSDQTMLGYEESIDRLEWTASLYGVPASMWKVGIQDFYGLQDCGACTLQTDINTTQTSIDVTILDTCTWSHAEGDFNLKIRDEEVTVTAVGAPAGGGSAWTQNLTVIRSVNGIVLSHPAGISVNVAQPFIPVL